MTPWTVAHQVSLSITISWSLLKLMSIESVMPSNHLILCRPFLLLPSIFPSIRTFSNELALHIRWPKYWSFSFSIIPSNEYSGLSSFMIDWFSLLSVLRTLKSLLQHHSLTVKKTKEKQRKQSHYICPQKDLYKNVHSSFILLTPNWKQPKGPLKGKQINKLYNMYTVKLCTAV